MSDVILPALQKVSLKKEKGSQTIKMVAKDFHQSQDVGQSWQGER